MQLNEFETVLVEVKAIGADTSVIVGVFDCNQALMRHRTKLRWAEIRGIVTTRRQFIHVANYDTVTVSGSIG